MTQTQQDDSPTAEATELAARLEESSLFSGLSEALLLRLARSGAVLDVKRNDFVFREGDSGDKVYLVLEGAIRISRTVPGMGEEALAILKPGSAFGEMSLIDGSPRSADARGHEASRLYVVAKQEMERLMFVDRTLAVDLLWKMVRILSDRLRQTNDKMTFLSITGRFE
jgi:CRP/FNR family cyclic AMP-dependent transcriptional regulator